MAPKIVAFLFCRFFALYCLSQAIIFLSSFSVEFYFKYSHLDTSVYLIAILPLAYLIMGIFFWSKTDWLAGKIVGQYCEQSMPLTLEDMQKTGFAIIGMFLLGTALRVIGSHIITPLINGERHILFLMEYIRFGVQAMIGVFLILASGWLTQLTHNLKKL